jgi:hypothetical protein
VKNLIYILLTFFLFIFSTYSQQKDSLIQLYPGLGDTINLFDREYFNLYKNIEGFQKASLYVRHNSRLISRLTLDIYGDLIDTIFIQPISILEKVQADINKIVDENEKRTKIKANTLLTLEDDRSINGQFNMFSQENIYFVLENDFIKEFQSTKFKIPVSKVDKINILGESKTWSYAGWGALIGLAVGGIIYFSKKDDITENPGIGGGGFKGIELFSTPILGGLIGLITGSISSTNDVIYKINSEYDLLKLKNYAKYYFRYDESVEELYREIEY